MRRYDLNLSQLARSTIGLPALVYVDPTVTANVTTIKAAHITGLRDGVK